MKTFLRLRWSMQARTVCHILCVCTVQRYNNLFSTDRKTTREGCCDATKWSLKLVPLKGLDEGNVCTYCCWCWAGAVDFDVNVAVILNCCWAEFRMCPTSRSFAMIDSSDEVFGSEMEWGWVELEFQFKLLMFYSSWKSSVEMSTLLVDREEVEKFSFIFCKVHLTGLPSCISTSTTTVVGCWKMCVIEFSFRSLILNLW